jgi:hypothetical protein
MIFKNKDIKNLSLKDTVELAHQIFKKLKLCDEKKPSTNRWCGYLEEDFSKKEWKSDGHSKNKVYWITPLQNELETISIRIDLGRFKKTSDSFIKISDGYIDHEVGLL